MRIRVLGSAAGGGFPQWNCGCENCRLVRANDARVQARTQDSIAVEGKDGWLLVNASPDLLEQIKQTSALWPRARRDTPIRAIALTNGDMDHVLGLFSIRESQPLVIYATDRVWNDLAEKNAIFRTLRRFEGHVTHRKLALEVPTEIPELGITLTAIAAPGKPPVHLMIEGAPHPEENVALKIEQGGKTAIYATAMKDARALAPKLSPCDVLLLDGTFWSSDELVAGGLGTARAEDMAHHPLSGETGSIASLGALPGVKRKIFTHVNNTNPILREDSSERSTVLAAGWEIATDGLEIEP
ncbi:MAG TPA: pyrroloquinoline quinone biosynthesis protein PqqB [Polyangiaceae bacterium]